MSATLAAQATGTFRPSFYLWMTLLMAFFVFAGFGMTYFAPLVSGNFPPAPPVVHLHGIVFSTWMILLVVQAALVNTSNIALHRSLGTYGIAHATAVLFTGALITLLGIQGANDTYMDPSFLDAMYLLFAALLGFVLLFTLSLRNTRRPEIHRRLMLFAILPLMPPGVNRFFMVPFNLDYIPVLPRYLTLDTLALMILVQEWRSTGRVGKYSMIGAGWIFVQSALHVTIADSESFLAFCRYVASLAHYR